METTLIVFLAFLLMFGLGYVAVSRVVEDSVFRRLDRAGLAFLIGISLHVPFYILMFLELNALWLPVLYVVVWASGVFFIKSRIQIPFSLDQSFKLYLVVFWRFLKVLFIAVGLVALIKIAIVGVLLVVDSL
jgi:hypothetical protein